MAMRTESDLIGELQIPIDAYYGVQTQRAIENFSISTHHHFDHPEFIKAFAWVKKAAAQANFELNVLDSNLYKAISAACDEVISGQFNQDFPTDMVQGGAGTSMNMNANEVIANRALELMGYKKGDYKHCSPNDHVNASQSTNDAYPTALKLALFLKHLHLLEKIKANVEAFRAKGIEFSAVVKMGRTQLQDAVPMSLGQEFEAFAVSIENEIKKLNFNAEFLLEINMGATAIGTGLNAPKGYAKLCTAHLAKISGFPLKLATNLIEATPDTSAYVNYSSALKSLAIKVSKICNDLRLLASGPRAGLHEIHLPAMQPGSSIMPGKVNPVIPEVVNQVCFKVIGNDLTISLAAEAGQLQLNVMEPIIAQSLMESIDWMNNAMDALTHKCVKGIQADVQNCEKKVRLSIGIVTALNPYIGYKKSTQLAKEALETGKSIHELVLEKGWMDPIQLEEVLNPGKMI